MKRKLISLLVGVGLIVAVFSGCEGEITITITSVTGKVVDSRLENLAGEPGVAVTFTKVDGGGEQTATTEADGTFSMAYTGEGLYQVEASKDGWFFIPQKVYIGNWLTSVPDILGIELDKDPSIAATSISLILTWNNSYQDLDAHLTFPDGNGLGFEGSSRTLRYYNTFTNPYETLPSSDGFGPNTQTNREHVYWPELSRESNNTAAAVLGPQVTSDEAAIKLDRDDDDGMGPEVITIRSLPFWITDWESSIYGIEADETNRLPEWASWTWVGVMEYYVDGYSSSGAAGREDETVLGELISSENLNADAMLHVIQGSNLLGVFKVPEYANIRTASLLKINMFIGEKTNPGDSWHLQFVPDIQIVDYDGGLGILSVGDEPAQVFGASGTGR